MSTLYLLQYNNYYNRIVKYYDTLNDYLTNIPASRRRQVNDINFFYNDQVNTVQTINYAVPEQIPEQNFDYLLVNNDNYGLSRWFIIECKWNRKGQQILTLRRDLLVDFMGSYLTQPLFAEKGCISTYTSTTIPIISNPENISVSQILESKTNLAASSRAIVGYIDRTYAGGKMAADIDCIYVNSIDELGISDLIGTQSYDIVTNANPFVQLQLQSSTSPNAPAGWDLRYNMVSQVWTKDDVISPMYSPFATDDILSTAEANLKGIINGMSALITQDINSQLGNVSRRIGTYANRNIMIGDTLYRLTVTKGSQRALTLNPSSGVFSQFCQSCQSKNIVYRGEGMYSSVAGMTLNLGQVGLTYSVLAQPVTVELTANSETGTFTFTTIDNRTHCGQPYDIFYMADSAAARQTASIIAARLYGTGALYDLQLLPYAPDTTGASSTTINGITTYWIANVDATYSSTSFTKSYSTAIDGKVGCLCDTVRICSPNHANSWDFNPAQNGGVTGFNIRCTFKPFTPYIHIKPIFSWMYGIAYTTDPRGLICGGSFSLPFVTDKWANYQANNSAYYNAFERDIENLSTTQDAQRKNEMWQMIAGTVAGAGYGAAVGSNMSGGNPVGSAIGAVAGGTASLLGALADREMNEKLRNDALDYRRDMFGFNSQNMIASPRTLARTSSMDIDWNGPAYVEFYSASDTEKANIRSKLKYNGFTLNYLVRPNTEGIFVSGIPQLLNTAKVAHSNYVKGRLIYTTDYDDTHIFNELANEWFKGFYWEGATLT